jgi:hypothetical protein
MTTRRRDQDDLVDLDGALLVGFELFTVGAACSTGSAGGGEMHLEVEDGVVLGAAALDFDCCVEDAHQSASFRAAIIASARM